MFSFGTSHSVRKLVQRDQGGGNTRGFEVTTDNLLITTAESPTNELDVFESNTPKARSSCIESLHDDAEASSDSAPNELLQETDNGIASGAKVLKNAKRGSGLTTWKGWKRAFGESRSKGNLRRYSIWNISSRGEDFSTGSSLDAMIPITFQKLDNSMEKLISIWVEKVFVTWPPNCAEVRKNQALKSLIGLGIPSELRGEYWKKIIGNPLQLTTDLYRILSVRLSTVRTQLLQLSTKYSSGLNMVGTSMHTNGPLDRLELMRTKVLHRSPANSLERTQSNLLLCSPSDHDLPVLQPSRSFPIPSKPQHVRSEDLLLRNTFETSVDNNWALSDAVHSPTSPTKLEVDSIRKSFEAIAVDLHRTIPKNETSMRCQEDVHTASLDPEARGLITSLRSILEAWVIHRPDIGYVQGMACLAATLLFNMDEFSSFVCLANLLCKDTLLKFYRFDIAHIRSYCSVFDLLLAKYFPKISYKIENSTFTSDVFLIEWWFTLFTRSLPPKILHRVWDHYLLDGDIVLFQVSLGIIKYWQESLETLPVDEGLLVITSGLRSCSQLTQEESMTWPQFVQGIRALKLRPKSLRKAFAQCSRLKQYSQQLLSSESFQLDGKRRYFFGE